KIGIIREGKVPPDNRTPLTPRQCHELMEKHSNVQIFAEWSAVRCYTDEDYRNFKVDIVENLDECDLLLGIKEVPVDKLVANKTYMFFSHTIKKQPHNRKLLQTILQKNIRLIDLELLTDERGNRLIGFGRWAGIVGAHYALLMLGKRTGTFDLKPAKDCINLQELVDQYDNIQFPAAKFVITGGGRVANGALEIMIQAGIKEVNKEDFCTKHFTEPVYTQLHSEDLYERKDGSVFDKKHFYSHPDMYKSAFAPYASCTDVLINCMFWDPKAPQLFQKDAVADKSFNIQTIADISCDVDGSVPLTTRVTSIEDPVFGYHRYNGIIGKPYQADTIDVMAVPNLPNELPKDASRDFGIVMQENILPEYLKNPQSPIFERATIAQNGKLTEKFTYLQDYVNEL
ncbi:MAG: NAD(P)-dependent oxidoreductase, partial [Bacteroidia bacterium]